MPSLSPLLLLLLLYCEITKAHKNMNFKNRNEKKKQITNTKRSESRKNINILKSFLFASFWHFFVVYKWFRVFVRGAIPNKYADRSVHNPGERKRRIGTRIKHECSVFLFVCWRCLVGSKYDFGFIHESKHFVNVLLVISVAIFLLLTLIHK